MISVPAGGVSERDNLSFDLSELIETGGECVSIDCDQVNSGDVLDENGVRDGVGEEGGERGWIWEALERFCGLSIYAYTGGVV